MRRTSSFPSSTTQYLLGGVFETDGNGTISASYADGPAGSLAAFAGPPSGSSTTSFLYYDAHGNLAAESDSTGTQNVNHTYDPFGAPLESQPANTTVHRYTGRWNKQYDTSSDLVLMGARPYDPSTGRFLGVDPVPGGSLNNYDYAGEDPINNYDLSGSMTDYGNGAKSYTLGQIIWLIWRNREAILDHLEGWAKQQWSNVFNTKGSGSFSGFISAACGVRGAYALGKKALAKVTAKVADKFIPGVTEACVGYGAYEGIKWFVNSLFGG